MNNWRRVAGDGRVEGDGTKQGMRTDHLITAPISSSTRLSAIAELHTIDGCDLKEATIERSIEEVRLQCDFHVEFDSSLLRQATYGQGPDGEVRKVQSTLFSEWWTISMYVITTLTVKSRQPHTTH